MISVMRGILMRFETLGPSERDYVRAKLAEIHVRLLRAELEEAQRDMP